MKKEEDWEAVERKLRKGDNVVRPRLRKVLPDSSTQATTQKDNTNYYLILIGAWGVALILLIAVCFHIYYDRPDLNMDYYTNINEHPVEIHNITTIQEVNRFVEPNADYSCLQLQMGDEIILRCQKNG